MKKIDIKEPCHENWNEFTPTQRGAFCGSCQINVIDFTNKTNEEIKFLLLKNSGKHMCGRFTENQLEDLNQEFYLWENQNTQVFQSKFLWALLLCFGFTLFSCAQETKSEIEKHVQNIELNFNETNLPKEDTTIHVKGEININDTIPKINNTNFVKGKIKQPEKCEVKEEKKLVGEFIAPEIHNNVSYLGGFSFDENYVDYLEQTVSDTLIQQEEKITDENEVLTDKFEAKVFPNPTSDFTQLEINVLAKEKYLIEVYDLNGKRISQIINQQLEAGNYTYRINLSNFEAGIYIIKIVTNTQNETVKVIKN